jgi:hypothetical protein
MLMMQPPLSPNCFTARLEVSRSPRTFRVELAVKLLRADVLQRQVGEHTGIVDEDVHIAEMLLCLVEEAIDPLRRGHASLHCDGLSAGRVDPGDDTIRAFSIGGVVHGDSGALFRERHRHACPNSLRSSCYESDLSIKLAHFTGPLCSQLPVLSPGPPVAPLAFPI